LLLLREYLDPRGLPLSAYKEGLTVDGKFYTGEEVQKHMAVVFLTVFRHIERLVASEGSNIAKIAIEDVRMAMKLMANASQWEEKHGAGTWIKAAQRAYGLSKDLEAEQLCKLYRFLMDFIDCHHRSVHLFDYCDQEPIFWTR
jgi:hypothetical protein